MYKVYPAQQNADLTEGRGPMVTKALFTSEGDAQRAAETLEGVMGHGHGKVGAPIVVYQSLAEYMDERYGEVRKQALAKLTREERRALGLA